MNKLPTPTWDKSDFEKRVRDPDRWLELLQTLTVTRSPYFAWEAIRVCRKHRRPIPAWIADYLGECADRMLSDKAKRAGDVRKTLLWVFGFPEKKPGPGGLFDQYNLLLKKTLRPLFAINFALKLYQGEQDVVKARRDTGDEVFGPVTGNTIDDRTLQRILLEQFQLKHLPLTAEEWVPVLDRHLLAIAERMVPYNH
jgi:hypothetical protein